jgi:hypothetical protein
VCCKASRGFCLSAFVEAKAHLTAHVIVSCSPTGVAPKVTTQVRLHRRRIPFRIAKRRFTTSSCGPLNLSPVSNCGQLYTIRGDKECLRKLSGYTSLRHVSVAHGPSPGDFSFSYFGRPCIMLITNSDVGKISRARRIRIVTCYLTPIAATTVQSERTLPRQGIRGNC